MQINKPTDSENEFFARQDAENMAKIADEKDSDYEKSMRRIASSIKAGMPVLCANGGQFATVDHMEGESLIKLKKDEAGIHHVIPLTWVTSIARDSVKLDRSQDKAMQHWSALA